VAKIGISETTGGFLSGETLGRPSEEDLVSNAAAMVPALRERSQYCEQLRRIPDQTITDIKSAGFHRIAMPARFGGMEYGIDTVTRVAMEIGRGCGSTAWMTGQWPGHNFMVGMFKDEAQEEYWGGPNGVNTLSSTASAIARLNVSPEQDGIRVDGQLRFSSGCDAAEWILFLGPTHLGLVPRSDFTILDDWHVMGLRGTGSKSVVITDAYIPNHRLIPMEMLGRGRSYGASTYRSNPYYRVPLAIVLNVMLLSPTIGMARGILELFTDRALERIDLHTGERASERPGAQLRFAESSAEVDAASLILRRICDDFEHWGALEDEMPLADRTRIRRDIAFATKLCLSAANRLLEQGDASGMYDSHPLQRLGRDIHMAGLQVALTWDEPALSYARVHWGFEPSSRFS
jgi:alkylation response protein AidB-like acyl-CoA dehydrogenase